MAVGQQFFHEDFFWSNFSIPKMGVLTGFHHFFADDTAGNLLMSKGSKHDVSFICAMMCNVSLINHSTTLPVSLFFFSMA